MKTIDTSTVPTEQLDTLVEFATNIAGPQLRDVLISLSQCIEDGVDLAVVEAATTLTPNQAANHLGMSRNHLYKLLDRGEIPSHRVGRDRRIQLIDLVAFEAQRDHDRRELAERFAKKQQTHVATINEIAGLL